MGKTRRIKGDAADGKLFIPGRHDFRNTFAAAVCRQREKNQKNKTQCISVHAFRIAQLSRAVVIDCLFYGIKFIRINIMNDKGYTGFKPERGFRQVRVFIIVFSLFTLAGVVPLAFGLIGPGLALIIMGLAFLALVVPKAAAWGLSYGIDNEAVVLRSGRAGKRIAFIEIDSVALLTKEQAQSFMEELYYDAVQSEIRMDMGGWLRSNRAAGGVTRYLSIPVTGTEIRRGGPTNITSYSVNPGTKLLLIRMHSGERLLVSPLEINRFYTRLIQAGVDAVPYVKGEGRIPFSAAKPYRNNRKRIFIVSLVTFIVILALAGYFIIYPALSAPAENAEVQPAEEAQPAGAGIMAAWVNEDSYLFGVLKEELPEMERNGGLSAMLFSRYAAPLLLQLLESEGELPKGASTDAGLRDWLSDFLMLHSSLQFSQEHSYPDGSLYMIYTVEQTEMKNNIGALLQHQLE